MAATYAHKLENVAAEMVSAPSHPGSPDMVSRVAEALEWTTDPASIEELHPLGVQTPLIVARAAGSDQPAAVFGGDGSESAHDVLAQCALYAYHAAIPWGLALGSEEAILFHSHWLLGRRWYQLPPVHWRDPGLGLATLGAVRPETLVSGQLERLALSQLEPTDCLVPVDEALVDRLDHWRGAGLRYADKQEHFDHDLQLLFAQLFVLRAIEDRHLAPGIPSLEEALGSDQDTISRDALESTFGRAKELVQSQLFAERAFDVPDFVLHGIIRDLYTPLHLPGQHRYNFAWMRSNVLGRAYEKYLSSVPVGAAAPLQRELFGEPRREVTRRANARKAAGVYYTPAFLATFLASECIKQALPVADGTGPIPRIVDTCCGSGSFLTAAADLLLRTRESTAGQGSTARRLIEDRRLIGIDIDPQAVSIARLSLWLRLAEEPDPLPLPSLEGVIVEGDALKDETWASLPSEYDIVLGNPPFLATAGVPSRQELATRYRTATGRFDYAYLFVELAVRRLREGGVLGLVVPNRLFRNQDAGALRRILTTEATPLLAVDFGAMEVFADASSYTGAIIARKGSAGAAGPVRTIRVRELPARFAGFVLSSAVASKDDVRSGYVAAYDASVPHGDQPWMLLSGMSKRARLRLQQQSVPLHTVSGIYQGIKTGANDVFVVQTTGGDSSLAQITNGFGETGLVERHLLRPVVSGPRIRRYEEVQSPDQLIWPYDSDGLIAEERLRSDFPEAYGYLLGNRGLLQARVGVNVWYELVRRRDDRWLSSPKLLTRDLVPEMAFALDRFGDICVIGGTAVVPADTDLLLPLLAYLNSSITQACLSQMAPVFRAGFYKIEPQHLARVDVPEWLATDSGTRAELTVLAEQVLSCVARGEEDAVREHTSAIDTIIANAAGIRLEDLI